MIDQLIAKLRASIPDAPDAVYCRPLRVSDVELTLYYLEYLKALDAGVRVLTEAFAPEPPADVERGSV